MPGMRMSRNATSVGFASNAATASPPLPASIAISSSGQASAEAALQLLAQQRLVFGDQRRRHHTVGLLRLERDRHDRTRPARLHILDA